MEDWQLCSIRYPLKYRDYYNRGERGDSEVESGARGWGSKPTSAMLCP